MVSKRITSAPSCASVSPPSGAATNAEPSTTRSPVSSPIGDQTGGRVRGLHAQPAGRITLRPPREPARIRARTARCAGSPSSTIQRHMRRSTSMPSWGMVWLSPLQRRTPSVTTRCTPASASWSRNRLAQLDREHAARLGRRRDPARARREGSATGTRLTYRVGERRACSRPGRPSQEMSTPPAPVPPPTTSGSPSEQRSSRSRRAARPGAVPRRCSTSPGRRLERVEDLRSRSRAPRIGVLELTDLHVGDARVHARLLVHQSRRRSRGGGPPRRPDVRVGDAPRAEQRDADLRVECDQLHAGTDVLRDVL